jgi:hypothetical protein
MNENESNKIKDMIVNRCIMSISLIIEITISRTIGINETILQKVLLKYKNLVKKRLRFGLRTV